MRHTRAALVLTLVVCLVRGVFATTTVVHSGDNLQTAINAAGCGDILELDAGATFGAAGGFTLPVQPGCTTYTTIRTGSTTVTGTDPCTGTGKAKVRATVDGPSIRTVNSANHWRIEGLEITHGDSDQSYGIIRLGDNGSIMPYQDDLSLQPHHFQVVGNYIHPEGPVTNERRGVALNSGYALVQYNCIAGIVDEVDAQGIGGTNGTGPYDIFDNDVEAAGENILFGGSDPLIADLTPCDINIRGNNLRKNLAWFGDVTKTVKNLLELKNACRVTVRANTLRYSPLQNQDGYAILLTPRNQDGDCEWCVVEDVTIEYNTIRDAVNCFQISGRDFPNTSAVTNHITIRHNICETNDATYGSGGGGFAFSISAAPHALTITRNTFVNEHTFTQIDINGFELTPGLVLTGNLFRYGDGGYGIKGPAVNGGNPTFSAFIDTDYTFSGNYIGGVELGQDPTGNDRPINYPGTTVANTWPTQSAFEACFVTYAWPYRVSGSCTGAGAVLQIPARLRFTTSE